jgi:hypothetical protein
MPISVATFCHIWSLNLNVESALEEDLSLQSRTVVQAVWEGKHKPKRARRNITGVGYSDGPNERSVMSSFDCRTALQEIGAVHTERRVSRACFSSPRPR